MNSAIQHIERLVQTIIGKDMRVQYDYSRRDLTAELDLAQLTSALVNMIKNARDAMSGGGRIIVSTRLEQDQTIVSGLMSGFAADPRWKTAPFEANDLLAKPFSQRELVSAITKILN